MRVIRSMKPLPSEAALYKWIRVVIRSCAYDRFRVDLRRSRREQIPRPVVDHDDMEQAGEQMRWLNDQLNQLDDKDVRLIIMRHRFGWTLDHIGKSLDRRQHLIGFGLALRHRVADLCDAAGDFLGADRGLLDRCGSLEPVESSRRAPSAR